MLDDIRDKLSNNEFFNGKAINYRKDGSTFTNEWYIRPIIDNNSQCQYYLAVQRDVTEQEKAYNTVLEDKNKVLHQLLLQIEWEKQKVKEDVASNIKGVLLPSIKKLKRRSQTDHHLFTTLENNLRELNSNFGRNLIEKNFGLSPREVEIANLIRQGLNTKVIASTLNITVGTVELHRKHIRKKLGIGNTGESLTHYLQTL